MAYITIILSGEYVIAIVAVAVFFVVRARLRRAAARAEPTGARVFPRSSLALAGALGILANLLFLLPVTVPVFGPVVIVPEPWQVLPGWTKYAIAPAVGAVAVLVLIVAVRRWAGGADNGPARGLDPTPRRWSSFAPRRGLWGSAALGGLIVATVVVAGLFAGTDENGRSTLFWMRAPGGGGATTFPGWYWGLPALLAALLVVALGVAVLALIARPALPRDESRDAQVRGRRIASGTVVALVGAALALTLGRLWIFVAVAGTMSTHVTTVEGSAWFGTPYEAMTPILGLAGALLVGAGLSVFGILLFPPRTRAASRVDAEARAS